MNNCVCSPGSIVRSSTPASLRPLAARPQLKRRAFRTHPRYGPCLASLHPGTYPIAMRFEDYIEIRPGVRSGKPCFKGTRITVYDVLEYLAGGTSQGQLLDEFPALTPEHIRAALAFAAARERRLASGSVA